MTQANRQAGAEIEITPEMIEAGVSVLVASGRVSPSLTDWAARELVQDILQAALAYLASSPEGAAQPLPAQN